MWTISEVLQVPRPPAHQQWSWGGWKTRKKHQKTKLVESFVLPLESNLVGNFYKIFHNSYFYPMLRKCLEFSGVYYFFLLHVCLFKVISDRSCLCIGMVTLEAMGKADGKGRCQKQGQEWKALVLGRAEEHQRPNPGSDSKDEEGETEGKYTCKVEVTELN